MTTVTDGGMFCLSHKCDGNVVIMISEVFDSNLNDSIS